MLDINKIRAQFPILSRKVNGQELVYFDNGATTQKPQAVIDAEKDLAGVGRVLLRASGTESLVRVMVEANDLQLANKVADSLAQLVRLELK